MILPAEHPIYVPGHGEMRAGDIEVRTETERLADTESATVRMWVAIAIHNPKAKPWRDGHFDAGGRRYPLSVFTSDELVRLSTSSGTQAENAYNALSGRSQAKRLRTSA